MQDESKHIDIRTLVEKYVWGETTAKETALVEEAIASDAGVEKDYNELYKIYLISQKDAVTDKINVARAKTEFFDRIKSNPSPKVAPKRKLIPLFIKITTAAAALLILFLSIRFLFVQKDTTEIILASGSDSVLQKTLPDGSIVDLNKNSSIRFLSSNSKIRNVQLDNGEVFFDVKKDSTKPFVINVGDYTVTVLGTSFNIDNTNHDSIVISVFTGRVEVKSKIDKSQSIILTAEEAAIMHGHENKIVKLATFDSNSLFWKTKILEFNEVNILEAISVIEDSYNVKIKVTDSVTSDCFLTAKFNNQPIKAVMEIIEFTFGAKIENKDNVYYIANTSNCM